MPIYKFEDTNTGEVFEDMMSWDNSLIYLEENPHMRRIIGAPKIVSGVGTNLKVTDSFKEAVARVKENVGPSHNIKDY